jgi:hypothetical protein
MGSFIPASRQQTRSHGFLFVVADGVGGMDLGEVASATAVSVSPKSSAKRNPDPCSSVFCRGSSSAPMWPCTIARSTGTTAATKWPPPRGLRPALRPGRGLARRRFALLPGAQRPGPANHAGPHAGQRAAQDGPDLRRMTFASSDSRHVLIRSVGRRCSSRPTPRLSACSRATCSSFAPTACTTRCANRDRVHCFAKERCFADRQ